MSINVSIYLFAILLTFGYANAVPFYGDFMPRLTTPSLHGYFRPIPLARLDPYAQASQGYPQIWPQTFANPSLLPVYSDFNEDAEFVPLEQQQGRTEGPSGAEKPFDVDVVTTDIGGQQAPGIFFQQSFPFFGQEFFNTFSGFGIGAGPSQEPWWNGANVCTEKTEDEKDMNEKEDDEDTEQVLNGASENVEVRAPLFGQFHFSVNSCVDKPNKYVCTKIVNQNGKKKTLKITRQCCHGYGRARNAGYTTSCEKIDIKNIEETAADVDAKDFIVSAKSNGGLNDMLANNKKITFFMPTNEAFKRYSEQMQSENNLVESRNDEVMKKLYQRHAVDGEISLYDVANEDILKTLDDSQTIRINTYQMPVAFEPEAMRYTANCVPIAKHDKLSEQGLVHTLQGVMKPITKNVMDLIRERGDLSIMRTVLEKTKLNELLEGNKPVSIFVPTDDAFDKLEPQLRRALKEGKGCATNILKNHILDLTFCSVASVPGARTTAYNLLGEAMRFNRSATNKQKSEMADMAAEQQQAPVIINGIAKISEADIMGTNGVLHIIDTILPTESALPMTTLMQEKNVTIFKRLVEAAGLVDKFEDTNNITVLAPTDKAMNQSKWAKMLEESPEELQNNAELAELLNYHIVSPMIKTCDLTEQLLPTATGQSVRVNLYSTHALFTNVMNRATVNCARLVHFDDESCGSVLHQVDKVLEPPKMNLMQLLESNPNYSKFLEIVRLTNLSSVLTNMEEGYTLLVPKNDVFDEVEEWETPLTKDKNELENLVQTHIVNDVVCCAGIIPTNWPFVRSIEALNGAHLRITRDRRPKIENAGITKCDAIATNGIIHEINDIIVPQRQRNRQHQHHFQQHNGDINQFDDLFF